MSKQERLLEERLKNLVDLLNMKVNEWDDNTQSFIIFVDDGILHVEPINEAEAEEVFSDDDSENPFGVLPWRSE